jgi:hypothetical protein
MTMYKTYQPSNSTQTATPAAPAPETNPDPEPAKGRPEDMPYLRSQANERHAAWQARQDAAKQAEQQAEALRVELLQKQQTRLAREAIAGLSDADRAEYNKLTDPETHISRMVAEARAQIEAQTIQAIEARKHEEFAAWRTKHPKASQWELHTALQDIKGRAEESKKAFLKAREDRELEAEVFDDPITRALAVLDDDGTKLFAKAFQAWRSRDPMADVRAAKKMQVNAQLRAQSEKEIMEMRTPSWKYNVRMKYRALGLDV